MNRKSALLAATAALAAFLVVAGASIWWRGLPGDGGGSVAVSFSTDEGDVTFACEVADTPEERSEGLSGREHLGEGNGMLFVFQYTGEQTFWMKDCLIPLDIVFVWENGTVGAIYEAPVEPGVADGDLARYESPGPVKWVVELNMGTCAARGIAVGSQFEAINVEA